MDNYSFFNALDYVYIFIILISSFFGLASGFTKIVLSAATWYGSFVVSTSVSPLFFGMMGCFFTNKSMARGAASGFAYIFILIIMRLLVNFISDGVKQSALSIVDRALGLLIGFVRGIIVPACVCAVFLLFDISRAKFDIMKNSRVSSIFLDAMESVVPKIEKKKNSKKIRTDDNSDDAVKASKPKNKQKKHPTR